MQVLSLTTLANIESTVAAAEQPVPPPASPVHIPSVRGSCMPLGVHGQPEWVAGDTGRRSVRATYPFAVWQVAAQERTHSTRHDEAAIMISTTTPFWGEGQNQLHRQQPSPPKHG